ncbi:Nucleosomal histone H3-Lys79 methylase [Mortierella hygrophila]|uniref:Histone-lysine N-methyltransferase, H3 lysine-79 specific n=1 Tax=Mortierella hygrophila TaxID=979708 RepID=A0A9P6K593_9FUNG|nr:Nucleosomal histone H3-Lys79 methylase [Mortierella hygrophila]
MSVPSSPAKDLSPIKKRRMESLLQAEASYSSPSSLSSLSPEPSDHSSSERELEEGEMSPSPAKEEGTNTTAQDRPKRATKEPPKKESPSQQALELELFGKIISKPKINTTTIATAASITSTKKSETSSKLSSINGGKQDSTLERKPTSTSSITKVKPVEYTDEEEYGSLGSIAKDESSLNNRSNGHLGANGKRSSLDNVRTSREILTINTQKGTVTSKTVKMHQKAPKPSNGTAIQRPSKSSSSVNTSKESFQKHSSSSAPGAASRRMSILHSDQIVAAAMGRYKNHFHMLVEDSDSTVASNPSSTGGDSMHVSLEYPGKDSREKFTLMKPFLSRSKTESDDKDEYNPIDDLVQTVRVIMEHFFTPEQYKKLFGTASEGLHRSLTKYKTRKDGAQFLKAVEEFNQIMRKQKSLGVIQEHVRQYGHRLPYDLVVHLLQQMYSRTVAARASKLNQYEAFSNNVYGEILPILTKEFIQRTKMDESKVFVDLGCGIGNVVLQVALQTGAESYGVEIMDTPAKFAKKQAREFEARTRAFGLNHGAVSMIHGDFLDTPGLAGILARADVVLVNNYAFNSALNQSLLQLFLDLKEGCKIISLKTFVSLDHKINVRNAGSVESILRVKKYPYYTNAVSWTHNGGEYFIATVDRSAVQAFWERAMTNGGASLDDGGSRRSSTRRR